MKLHSILIILTVSFLAFSAKNESATYQCTPCGLDCDKEIFATPGKCPKCHMALVQSATITFKNIESNKLCDYVKEHPKTILLDVRTEEEFEGKADPDFGTLKNAINIPIQELDKRLAELEKYKDRQILVYCSHSHRSQQAAYLLTQNRFKQVLNMLGGMSVLPEGSCRK